jgi:hypothetical protein
MGTVTVVVMCLIYMKSTPRGFIGDCIHRNERNVLISNLGLVSIPLGFIIFGSSYWLSFFVGKSFAAVIKDRQDTTITLSGKEPEVLAILEKMKSIIPEAIYGFSEEIKHTWTNDRASLIAKVDEARKTAV